MPIAGMPTTIMTMNPENVEHILKGESTIYIQMINAINKVN